MCIRHQDTVALKELAMVMANTGRHGCPRDYDDFYECHDPATAQCLFTKRIKCIIRWARKEAKRK